MSDYARGRDVQVAAVSAAAPGRPASIIPLGSPISASFNDDVTNERDNRLGEYESDTTQVLEGGSGQLMFRRDSHALEDVKRLIRESTLNRTKTPKFEITRAIYVPEIATTRTLVYPNCVFELQQNISGKNDAVEETVNFISGIPREIDG